MAKADKRMNKVVGGAKLPKFTWKVEAEGIELSGTAGDARSAALNASAARQAITDALAADKEIAEVDELKVDEADDLKLGKAPAKH